MTILPQINAYSVMYYKVAFPLATGRELVCNTERQVLIMPKVTVFVTMSLTIC